MKKILPLVFLSALPCAVSCSSDEEVEIKEVAPIVPDSQMTIWIDGQKTIANDLWQEISSENPNTNLIFSPFSMYIASSMVSNAAEGECLGEFIQLLNCADIASNNEYNRKIINTFPNLDASTTFNLANAVWLSDKDDFGNPLVPNQNLVNDLSKFYKADVRQCDLSSSSAAKDINEEIERLTSGMIKQHFPKGIKLGKFVFLNCLYFKSPWSEPFSKDKTSKERFLCSDNNQVSVDMMSATLNVAYNETDGAKAIKLPFGNGSFEMAIILPPSGVDVRDYSNSADAKALINAVNNNSKQETISIKIPKFEVEAKYNFVDLLTKMGYTNIFEYNKWNLFSGYEEDFRVERIDQCVKFSIDEEGGTAASSTSWSGNDIANVPSKTFEANRPFYYVVREKSCNLPIIVGTVEKF